MSEEIGNEQRSLQDEDTFAELLRMAGPRPGIDDERRDRVYARVLDAWQETRQPAAGRVYRSVLSTWQRRTAWSRWQRLLLPAAVAASAVLVAVLVLEPEPAARVPVGTISKVIDPGSVASRFEIGGTLYAGDMLRTGPGEKLGLLLARGESLRIDESSSIRLAERDRLVLGDGRIYADTGDFVYRDGGLVIETGLGSVADVGTRFSVALGSGLLDVAVREGRVDVTQAAVEHVAVAGERLLLRDDGEAERMQVAPESAFWSWAAALSPDFDIQDRNLLEFLKWVARETGLQLEFESDNTRMSAMRTDLHGSISGFVPLEALDSVLATTAFSYRIDGDRLVIRR
jgi:ferric-dicitrate binding protein FerR (iron transport regulator)